MSHTNQKFLTVCAAALLAFSASPLSAQEMQMGDKLAVPSGSAPTTEDVLNVPASQSAPIPSAYGAADQVPLTMNSAVPAPVSAPAPANIAMPAPATQVGSYNPRAVDRIINLRDAVAVGVLTNPETEAVSNNRRATDEELKQAKALYLPSVDMSANTGYESIYSDPKGAVPGHSDLWRSQASLTLTQMLFDGFATKYENERQYHRVRSASHRVRESAEYKALDVVEAYLDLLRQRELLQIAQENLSRHNEIMGQIIESANAGRTTEADVEQTKARVNAAEAQEAAVRQSFKDAESKYRRIVGDAPQPDIQVPVAPRNMIEDDLESEIKQVLTHSPTLDIKEADVNVADKEREATKSTFYPQVDFQAGATVGDNLDGVEGRTQSASALVIANWNLYRGGGDVARSREFVYRYAQAKDERNAAARALEQDVRQTWASMVASGERAAAFRKQADANGMVVEAYKDQFNLDRRTLLDVLDSQNEWFVSRSNAINNGYLEMFAIYRLLALRGDLLPTLGVSYPGEANPAFTSSKKG